MAGRRVNNFTSELISLPRERSPYLLRVANRCQTLWKSISQGDKMKTRTLKQRMRFLAKSTSHECKLIQLISAAVKQLSIYLIILTRFPYTGLETLSTQLINHRIVERGQIISRRLMLQKIKANQLRLRIHAIADTLYNRATELAWILASSSKAYFT